MNLLSAAQYAARWGVSKRLVLRWIAQGRLKATRVGSVWLIRADTPRPTPRKPPGKKGRG